VTRAIAISTERDYLEVYNDLKRVSGESPRNGVKNSVIRDYLRNYPFTSCVGIGTGTKVHVKKSELPNEGRYILRLSGHLVAYIDGVLYDSYDSSREGTRAVYGYWTISK